jgi:hypothetical protein
MTDLAQEFCGPNRRQTRTSSDSFGRELFPAFDEWMKGPQGLDQCARRWLPSMTVIHVNFRDKEHYALLRKVEEQLLHFGFDSFLSAIPDDAIAVAMDEVRQFNDPIQRKAALMKLEEHFRKRRQASIPTPIGSAQTKPKV